MLQNKVIFWILLLFVVTLPLLSPERNILTRQSLSPVLWMRLAALILLGLWIVSALISRKVSTRLSFFLTLILVFFLVGILANSLGGVSHTDIFGDSKAAFRGILFSLCLFLLILTAYNFATGQKLSKLITGIALSASLASGLGILQYFGIAPYFSQSTRVYSTLINPLELAGFLILVIPVLIVNFFYKTEESSLFALALRTIPILLAALCLLLTFSRSGIIALLISLALFLLGYSARQVTKLIPIAGIVLLLYAIVLLVPVKTQEVKSGFLLPSDTLTTSPSLASRLATWRIGMKMFAKKPIFGWGEADLGNQFRMQEDILFTREAGSDFTPFDLHNRFITTLVANGVLGLAIFIIILSHLFYSNRSLIWQSEHKKRNEVDEYRRGLFFGVLALLLHWQLAPAWVVTEVLFWIFLSILHATQEREQKVIDFEFKTVPQTVTTAFSIILVTAFTAAVLWGAYSAHRTLKAEYLATRGIDMATRTDYDQGAKRVKQAIALNPQEADYYGRLGYVFAVQGRVRQSEKPLQESIVAYKKAISINPEDPFRYERIALVCQSLNDLTKGKYLDELFKWTKLAVSKNPSSLGLNQLLAKLYLAKGEERKARTMLEKIQTAK